MPENPGEFMVVHFIDYLDGVDGLDGKTVAEKKIIKDKRIADGVKGVPKFFTRVHTTKCIQCGSETPKVASSHSKECTKPQPLDPRDLDVALDCSGVVFAVSGEQAEKAHKKFCNFKV